MKHSYSIHKLSKLLIYILGRQPDEFGLFPDEDGYVKIKDLVKALAEESGWRHVRLNHIREVIHTSRSPVVEMENNRIRAVDRSRLPLPVVTDSLPKLLYHPIRQRAHPVVLEKGIPIIAAGHRIVLAEAKDMAQRLGRRIDPSPVILTVNAENARKQGANLWRLGNLLFVADCLPPGSFSAPPLPKTRPEPKKVDSSETKAGPKTPGSYLLDLTTNATVSKRADKRSRQRKNEWKRDRKRKRRDKGF